MKKRSIENLRSKVIFVSLAIISSFLLIINFIPIFVLNEGITREFTGDLETDRIAYVNQSNPDKNYHLPLWEDYVVGNSSDLYVHFNLDLLPKATERLYFILREYYFDPYYGSLLDDIEINLILVESNWNSSEITWNSRPKHEEIIATVNVSEILQGHYPEYYNLEKVLDITESFKVNHLNDISFCINFTENSVNLNARLYLSGYGIRLLWYYEQVIISYTNIFSSVIIFSILIGSILYLRKYIHSCPECGTKRTFTEKVCSSCGKRIKKDILIKGSDYQLILIILWIFAFFEGSTLLILMQTSYYSFFLMHSIIFLLLVNWVILCIILILRGIKKYRKLRVSLKRS
ncbi:MAG: hypothetical protein HWN81_13090 [Candidatus Lokiarchaeota archaeon]|nr:hypothetical protein [Candidatus Lokiarchaeota archaeon]